MAKAISVLPVVRAACQWLHLIGKA